MVPGAVKAIKEVKDATILPAPEVIFFEHMTLSSMFTPLG